jgi:FAD binding domain/Berberine and berberine like
MEGGVVHNAMIDCRPAMIASCASVEDVIRAVEVGVRHGTGITIGGGGHHGAGLGSAAGRLLVDLSPMKGISLDPVSATVRVEAGCTWGEVDRVTHTVGAAVPSGVISTTGVVGSTSSGGAGYLTRKFGLTIDNLVAADVVLADGTVVRTDERRHPDLFWALRGGGGDIGVVTAFQFRLNPVHTVVGGPTLWPLSRARDVLSWYRTFSLEVTEDLYGFFAYLTVPPAAPFPAELHLKNMCGIVWCYTGDLDTADDAFAPVRERKPALDGIQAMPYPRLQRAFDALYPPDLQWFSRADFVTHITDDAIDRHIEHGEVPTVHSTMHLYPIDGAAHRVAHDATAFAYRDANWSMAIAGGDPDPANADIIRTWTIDYEQALHPFSSGGAYAHGLSLDEGHERVRRTYRHNYERLRRVKAAYDPDNVFHVNQHMPPSAGGMW